MRVRHEAIGGVRHPVVGSKYVPFVVLAELVVPLFLAQLKKTTHRRAIARPLQLVNLIGYDDEPVFHASPESLGRTVERRDAVSRSHPGAPFARRLGHERNVHVCGLDSGTLEHLRCPSLGVGAGRGPPSPRQGRKLSNAGVQNRELAQTTKRARNIHRAQVAQHDLIPAVLRNRVDKVEKPLNAPAVVGNDAVEGLQACVAGRRVGPRDPDDGSGKGRIDSDSPSVLNDAELTHFRFLRRDDRHINRLIVPLYGKRDRSSRISPNDSLNFWEARYVFAVDAHDAIAGLELAVRWLARGNDTYGRLEKLHVLKKDRRVERNGKEQVHRRPCQDNGDALPESLRLEGSGSLLGEDRFGVLALLEHFHESAEGQQRQTVLGLFAADANDPRTEADGKGQNLDPEDLGKSEMPRLVNEDERADQEDEVKKIHGG